MHTPEIESMQKLIELVKDSQIAMLTTVEADGSLHSRPMGTQDIQQDTLWFFLKDDSRKAQEVVRDPCRNPALVIRPGEYYFVMNRVFTPASAEGAFSSDSCPTANAAG